MTAEITEDRRKEIIEWFHQNRPLWQGEPATIAGWYNPEASLSTALANFWCIPWEAADRVASGESTLDQENIYPSYLGGTYIKK